MVLFRKMVCLVERNPVKMSKTGHFYSVRHPTPRRRSPRLGVELRLPKLRFLALSSPPRHSMLRLGEPLCVSVALLRLGVPVSPV